MRIGILTLHNSFSYGACLQAYATYSTIRAMGHDVLFINYVNRYEQDQNHIISRKEGAGLIRNIRTTMIRFLLRSYANNRRAFCDFHRQFNMTERYSSLFEMRNLAFDALVSGSDQLWNPYIFGGIDEAFFLNFGSASRRIAYAASAGSHVFSTEERARIIPLLKRYTAISVRENLLKEQVNEMLGVNAPIVVDPTFLLTREEWLNLPESKTTMSLGKYILVYIIGVPVSLYIERYAPVVEYYADKLGIPAYSVSSTTLIHSGCEKSLTGLSPCELIHAIDKAELIITSSFHGVALSMNLNKRFVALETSNPARVANLLQICGLSDRAINALDTRKCAELLDYIDYENANAALESMRRDSLKWLKEQLEE